MGAILSAVGAWALKFVPFLPALVEKFFPGPSSREKELEKEIELETVRRGRIPPKQLLWYVVVVAFGMVIFLSLLDSVFPDLVDEMPMKKEVMDLLHKAVDGGM
ncbi:MAG: hypothetical protein LBQ51_05705 [Desulfovibrio sp.]|jgi:hypothetical protein|nr:hypothetical protein [Desulfovibrio sp.]